MLGYVFWHWPRRVIRSDLYERNLVAFQRSLRLHAPDGLLDVCTFRVRRRPWSRTSGPVYEDWYLVESYASLGALNAGAVSRSNLTAHDEVAGEALGGTGSLFELRAGGLDLREARSATWTSKPQGTAYQEYLRRLTELVDEDEVAIWRRQLALGPSSEFCIQSKAPLLLPKSFRPVALPILPITGRER